MRSLVDLVTRQRYTEVKLPLRPPEYNAKASQNPAVSGKAPIGSQQGQSTLNDLGTWFQGRLGWRSGARVITMGED